ncbi:MAG TPA: IS481 family transposase [Acidimicrobiales bacterium]|nr:IS481 family transposase [Acidimicrobiales bacterium]
MRVHGNARLFPRDRAEMADRRLSGELSRQQAALVFRCSVKTVDKWTRRRAAGEAMTDRSSRPHRSPCRVPADRRAAIEALRRARLTQDQIAEQLAMPTSTVTLICRRLGLARLSALDPVEPVNRYERRWPGELIHIDIKKIGQIGRPGHRVNGDRRTRTRGIGWEFVHVAVDDATRLAYVEVLDDEKGATAVGFLRRAVAWFASRGVTVERVLTDNGTAYRSIVHRDACRRLGLRHLRTRPYRPRTNGKAERFIQTMLRGWAYGAVYATSHQRRQALLGWVNDYNTVRPHASLGKRPPASRLAALLEEQRLYD